MKKKNLSSSCKQPELYHDKSCSYANCSQMAGMVDKGHFICGPNSLICSFSLCVSPAHNTGRWVLPLYMLLTITSRLFSQKELAKEELKIMCE